jgi:hypothetical protein
MRSGSLAAALAVLALAGLVRCSGFGSSSPEDVPADGGGTSPPTEAAASDALPFLAPVPIAIATGLHGAYGIAVRGDALYVTENVPHGRVLRFRKGAEQAEDPVVLATEAALAQLVKFPPYVTKPYFVAATENDVFWTDLGELGRLGQTKLFSISLAGDAGPRPFYDLGGQGQVAVDLLHVFWANQATDKALTQGQNGLFRGDIEPRTHTGSVYFPVDEKSGERITPLAVALDGNRVFVGAGKQLVILDADKITNANGVDDAVLGGSPNDLEATPSAITSDFTHVYWTDDIAPGHVFSLPKGADGGVAPAVLASGVGAPLGITTADAWPYVYFTAYADGTLMRVRKDGSQAPEVVLRDLAHPALLTSDGAFLYFTVFGADGASTDGAVMRLPRPRD